ncbi:HIT family protein [Desulfobaculum sp. SPO524]|uniref:HIT family protein n=1 Tax=Desulfobaculum sp. SPO524 TaxID=3378071 RepID=UPI003852B6EE
MEVLWAPWRLDYILGPKPDTCPFCLPKHTDEDAARRILYRGRYSFVIMNIFPYNNGHLMVTPYRHVMSLVDLRPEEHHEMMDLMHESTRILTAHFSPQGINMGVNMGEAAGAGIKEHLHFHLVPRWVGDSSFMAFASETRVIPEHIDHTYASLKPYFDEFKTKQSAKEEES